MAVEEAGYHCGEGVEALCPVLYRCQHGFDLRREWGRMGERERERERGGENKRGREGERERGREGDNEVGGDKARAWSVTSSGKEAL